MDLSKDIVSDLLKEFKPILVIYFPEHYMLDEKFLRLEALKNKLIAGLEEKYEALAIPYPEDSFTIDIISVVKSKFINDRDLSKHISKLQKAVLEMGSKQFNKSKKLQDLESFLNKK